MKFEVIVCLVTCSLGSRNKELNIVEVINSALYFLVPQENIQILRDLSLLQIQMRDLEGYRVQSCIMFSFYSMS